MRPKVLEAEVVRFQNNKEKWVAFVGLLDGHPYEIFTGLQDDEEGISLPKSVTTGRIIKNIDEEVITAIAKQKPYYFVMRDSSMANDSVATNFDQIFATYSPDTVRKVL